MREGVIADVWRQRQMKKKRLVWYKVKGVWREEPAGDEEEGYQGESSGKAGIVLEQYKYLKRILIR